MHIFGSVILGIILFVMLGRFPELFPFLAPLQLGKITVLLGLIAVLMTNPQRITALLKDTPIGPYLFVFTFLALAGVPFSVYPSSALGEAIAYLRLLLIVSIMTALCLDNREQTLRKILIWIILIMAMLMILNKGTGRIHVSDTYDPNDIGLLFIVYLPIIVTEALLGGKWLRIVASATALCSVVAVALTGSRGGIVALAAVSLHTIFLIKKRRWLFISILALGALVVGLTADEALWNRFQALQDNTDYNLDARDGRIAIWKDGMHLMITHPIFGVGIGQFSSGIGTLGEGIWKVAHNSFVQIGTELGVIGLGAFILMLISVHRIGKQGATARYLSPKERQRFTAIRISLTGYCVCGFFLSQAYGFILYTFLVLTACMYLRMKATQPSLVAVNYEEEKHSQDLEMRIDPLPNLIPPRQQVAETISSRAEAVRKSREERLLQGDRLQKKSFPPSQ